MAEAKKNDRERLERLVDLVDDLLPKCKIPNKISLMLEEHTRAGVHYVLGLPKVVIKFQRAVNKLIDMQAKVRAFSWLSVKKPGKVPNIFDLTDPNLRKNKPGD